jgi:Na+/H+ antiporter NhaD/arsenite permease-like protein
VKNIIGFIRNETVLCAALVLAVISAFVIPPDEAYADYIDFRTLSILFCLMAVMAGFQKIGVFESLAQALLKRVKSIRQMVWILIMLCFFSGMLITNDVALITFVPFTFIVLNLLGEEEKKHWMIPIVTMQTIGANLGSMLTPIGNPQNLYLYGKAGISFGAFIRLMLPYSLLAFGLLSVWTVLGKGSKKIDITFAKTENPLKEKPLFVFFYTGLFAVCLMTVMRILPYIVMLCVVLVAVVAADRTILKKVDYALLLTFAGFFVFIGNMGRVPAFCDFLKNIIEGHEVVVSVIASQFISNVPTALLLSGFTENVRALIVGTNLGGLGTLIASMASLISFKYVAREDNKAKGRYILYFSVCNVLFLAVLLLYYLLLK